MVVKSIRIMFVVGNLHLGGAGKLVMSLVRGLGEREGFLCSVCCLGEGGTYAEELIRLGYDVQVLEYTKQANLRAPITALRIVRDLKALFRRERVDIVHTYLFFTGILGRIAARLTGIPVIVHSFFRIQNGAQRITERLLRRITQRYVVDSTAVRDNVARECGLKPAEVEVIYNGIDIARLDREPVRDLRGEWGFEPGNQVIGIVAHLSAPKGHSPYLRAFARVLATLPETRLILAGDGPLRERLENEAGELGIENRVSFLGPRSDLASILHTIDLLALPSSWEGFGIVQAEAMCFRVPVVGTNRGGALEVVEDGTTGILVSYGDVEGLANATLRLLGDADLRKTMGQAGRARVSSNFGVERMLDGYVRLYSRLLREPREGAISAAPTRS